MIAKAQGDRACSVPTSLVPQGDPFQYRTSSDPLGSRCPFQYHLDHFGNKILFSKVLCSSADEKGSYGSCFELTLVHSGDIVVVRRHDAGMVDVIGSCNSTPCSVQSACYTHS